MAHLMIRRKKSIRVLDQRSHRPRLETLEDRLAPTVGLSQIVDALDYLHAPYGPPVLDQQGDIFTYTTQSIIEIPAGSSSAMTMPYPTGLANYAAGDPGNLLNECLAVDSQGDVFGTYATTNSPENIFEIPAGTDQPEMVAQLGDFFSQAGIVDTLGVDDIYSMTVSDGYVYGLSIGAGGYGPTGITPTSEIALVWQVPITGGQASLLGSWQFPGTPTDLSVYNGYALTVTNGEVYGITVAVNSGQVAATVFDVPIGSTPFWNTIADFPVPPGAELAVSDGYVFGVTDNQVFDVPALGAGSEQLFQIPGTIGSGPFGGLVVDNGTIFGMLGSGPNGSGPAVYAINTSNPANLTFQTVALSASFGSLNGSAEEPQTGLAVDSQGNAYGIDYGATGIGIFKLTGLSSWTQGSGGTGTSTGSSGGTGGSTFTAKEAVSLLNRLTSEVKDWTNGLDDTIKENGKSYLDAKDDLHSKKIKSDPTKLADAVSEFNIKVATGGLQLAEYRQDDVVAEVAASAVQANVATQKFSASEQRAFDKALHEFDEANRGFNKVSSAMSTQLGFFSTVVNQLRAIIENS